MSRMRKLFYILTFHPVLVKWQSSDLAVLETPFIQIHGRDQNGNRVVWINLKYNNADFMESAKRAIAYHFESSGFNYEVLSYE